MPRLLSENQRTVTRELASRAADGSDRPPRSTGSRGGGPPRRARPTLGNALAGAFLVDCNWHHCRAPAPERAGGDSPCRGCSGRGDGCPGRRRAGDVCLGLEVRSSGDDRGFDRFVSMGGQGSGHRTIAVVAISPDRAHGWRRRNCGSLSSGSKPKAPSIGRRPSPPVRPRQRWRRLKPLPPRTRTSVRKLGPSFITLSSARS